MTDNKRTGIKVLLLVVGVVLCVGGILVFYKTKVSPPTIVKYGNQHLSYLNGEIKTLKDGKEQNDTLLFNIMDELSWYHRDDFINLQEYGVLTDSLAKAYVPIFISTSKAVFKQDIWEEAKLNEILSHISMLRGWITNSGDPVIGGSLAQGLKDIENTIGQYRKAWSIARSTTFHGIASAKSVIDDARYYSNLTVLQSCSSLMEALSNLAPTLEKQHFNILTSKVRTLENGWLYTNQDNYNARLTSASNAIKEYNGARSIYGGYASNTSALSASIKSYKNKADAYYLEKAREEFEREQAEQQQNNLQW